MRETDPSTGGPPRGVNIIGWYTMRAGLARSCQMNVRAIQDAGFDTVVNDFPSSLVHPNQCTVKFDTNLLHFQPDHWQLPTDLLEQLMEGRRNIGYWAWETNKAPQLYLEWTKRLDQVWVPSTFVKEALAGAHCPVHVVPHEVPIPEARIQNPEVREHFRILVCFDGKSRVARKNPFAAVQAFHEAFDLADESVQLIIKCHDISQEIDDAFSALQDYDRRIQVVDGYVDDDTLDRLYSTCDVLLSLHRGEGFGLHIAEAMARGPFVIATNFGGCTDFINGGNAGLVPFELVKANDLYYGREGSEWAQPSIASAASWLRIGRFAARGQMPANARRTIAENFSHEKLVARVKELLA